MARTTDQQSTSPSTSPSSEPNTGATLVPEANGRGPLDGRHDEPGHPAESDATDMGRRQGSTIDSDEHDRSSEGRDLRETRDEDRAFGAKSNSRESHDLDRIGDRGTEGHSGEHRELPPAMSIRPDAFAPVLQAWTEAFRSWSELAGTLVKVQQETFATMMGAATSNARSSADPDRAHADEAPSLSRTGAVRSGAIEQDRR